MSYRDEARRVASDYYWTVGKFAGVFFALSAVVVAVTFSLQSLGLIGCTIVERKVFENSYQRSEGLKSSIALDEATLAEIYAKLEIPGLDDNTRANLEAQAAAARIRINTAKRMQHE